MDHFNNLPDDIVVKIFRVLLLGEKHRLTAYSNFHLVCHRWHTVCVSWAEHLPKSTEKFRLCITDDGCCFPNISAKICSPKCNIYDGYGSGIKLMNMLRHFDTNGDRFWLQIKGRMDITDALLLQLIKIRLTNCYRFSIFDCDLSSVSEEVMTKFFIALAEGKCNSVGLYWVRSAEGVLTDQSLAAFIESAPQCFALLPDGYLYGITDATLDNLLAMAKKLTVQRGFNYRFHKRVKELTAQGVHKLIEAFCTSDCCVESKSELIIPERLKAELVKLRQPDAIFKANDNANTLSEKFIYRREEITSSLKSLHLNRFIEISTHEEEIYLWQPEEKVPAVIELVIGFATD